MQTCLWLSFLQTSICRKIQPLRQNQWSKRQRVDVKKVTVMRRRVPSRLFLHRRWRRKPWTHVSEDLVNNRRRSNQAYICALNFTARCQISDESKDEEIQEQAKPEKKSNKGDTATSSLASLNSNYRETSSSGSEHSERVRHACTWKILWNNAVHQSQRNHLSLCFFFSVISDVAGGSWDVRLAPCSQRRDDPLQGDQGQERHGEGHLSNLLPPHGEGRWKEGRHFCQTSNFLIIDWLFSSLELACVEPSSLLPVSHATFFFFFLFHHKGVSDGGQKKKEVQNFQLSHLCWPDKSKQGHKLLHRKTKVRFCK